jgi:hypothetical protein
MQAGETPAVSVLIAAALAAVVSVDTVARFFFGPLLPSWAVPVALVACAVAAAVTLVCAVMRGERAICAVALSLLCLILGSPVVATPLLAFTGGLLAPVLLATAAVSMARGATRLRALTWSIITVLGAVWLVSEIIPIGLVLGLGAQAATLTLTVALLAEPIIRPVSKSVRALWGSAAVR